MNIDYKQEWANECQDYTHTNYATSIYYDSVTPNIQEFITSNNIKTTYRYAQLALGLDDASTILFEYNNTLEDLKSMVSYIIEHKTLTGFV
jgi:hypothetical protein